MIKEEVLSNDNRKAVQGDTIRKEESGSSDEIVILKMCKVTAVSVRKLIRIQNHRREERKKLQALEDMKGKKLAVKFIFGENSVAYRPPCGFCGEFGINETAATSCQPVFEIDNNDNDNDDGLSVKILDDKPEKPKNMKNPKVGFITNEVISDNDRHDEVDRDVNNERDESEKQDIADENEFSEEENECIELDNKVIQNNVNKAIETLEEEDVQVDRIIEYMERNNSDAKNKVSVHAGCNVDLFMKLREEQKLEGLEADNRRYDNSDFWPKTTCETGNDGTATVDGNSEESDADEKRNDSFNTEPIQMDAFFARHHIDTKGLGKHKVLLNQMENSTSMKDRFLKDVLKDVISYPQDDGKDEGTVTESTGTGDNDEQSTDEYGNVNGNEKM